MNFLSLCAGYEDEKARGTGDADLHYEYSDRGQRRLGWTFLSESAIA